MVVVVVLLLNVTKICIRFDSFPNQQNLPKKLKRVQQQNEQNVWICLHFPQLKMTKGNIFVVVTIPKFSPHSPSWSRNKMFVCSFESFVIGSVYVCVCVFGDALYLL